LLRFANHIIGKTIAIFTILGVVLSCAHQSSLGTLLTIAPSKVHPLWFTPLLPVLFLLSAIAVGYPMVIFESVWAHRSFKIKSNMDVLAHLGSIPRFTIGLYLIVKIADMIHRGTYRYLFEFSKQSNMFLIELIIGIIIPLVMFWIPKVRKSEGLLFTAATLYVVFGVLLNRVNVFIISYQPPFAEYSYVPHILEILVTVGFISMIILLYRIFVTIFPIIETHDETPVIV
jgi:Ni/Fe-hydrogenase subunit HybB-like protein